MRSNILDIPQNIDKFNWIGLRYEIIDKKIIAFHSL